MCCKRTITKLVMKASPYIMIEILMSICVNLCVARGNSIISLLVDGMLQGDLLINKRLIIIFVVLVLGGAGTSFIQRFCAGTFANKVCTWYRKKVSDKLYKVQCQYIYESNPGIILNKITSDIGIIENLLDSTVPDIIANLLATIIYAIHIANINLNLFILMMISYPFIFWIANTFVKKVRKLTVTHREKADTMAGISQSVVGGILVIRAFRLENFFKKKMDMAANDLVENEHKRQRINNTTMVIRQMLQWLPNILCALYAAYITSQGIISLGSLIAFVLILNRFVDGFVSLPFAFVDVSMAMVSVDRIEEMLSARDEESGQYKGENLDCNDNVIEFNDLVFSYGTTPVVERANLTVKEYDNIAIIGESGCGKSTLVHLLCGLYDGYKGEIKLWGRSITEWDKESLRDKISLVSQDVFLFPVSIEENVAYGLEGSTHGKVVNACKEADIHEFIESLPNGYKTIVGERGTKLSGGQKQRLSIARAILKDAPLMIMDEPTSSIDVESENEIQKALEKISKNKTCITIAHRLNTIKNCNHVYRLENGKLIEKGMGV